MRLCFHLVLTASEISSVSMTSVIKSMYLSVSLEERDLPSSLSSTTESASHSASGEFDLL